MRFGLTEETLRKIKTIFSKFPDVEEVVLYGSRAKGNYKPGSDIDLTMKGNISHSTLLSIRALFDESTLPYAVDLSIFNRISNTDLIDHIRRVGVLVYKKLI